MMMMIKMKKMVKQKKEEENNDDNQDEADDHTIWKWWPIRRWRWWKKEIDYHDSWFTIMMMTNLVLEWPLRQLNHSRVFVASINSLTSWPTHMALTESQINSPEGRKQFLQTCLHVGRNVNRCIKSHLQESMCNRETDISINMQKTLCKLYAEVWNEILLSQPENALALVNGGSTTTLLLVICKATFDNL